MHDKMDLQHVNLVKAKGGGGKEARGFSEACFKRSTVQCLDKFRQTNETITWDSTVISLVNFVTVAAATETCVTSSRFSGRIELKASTRWERICQRRKRYVMIF